MYLLTHYRSQHAGVGITSLSQRRGVRESLQCPNAVYVIGQMC